jgi:two-component system, NtrC family, sensor kinase
MVIEQIKTIGSPIAATPLEIVANDKLAPARELYDLTRFSLADMVRCGSELRHLGARSTTQEEMAGKIVRHLYDHLADRDSGRRACILVRFFKTHPFAGLQPDLREFAQALIPSATLSPETKCLTLLASAGEEPQWNSRRNSRRHQAIPLLSEASVKEIPMIAQLLHQLGLKLSDLMAVKSEIIKDLEQKRSNVFHVPVARSSPFIPAQQEFVQPYGVESVVGFGGILPDRNLFAVIIFARVPVPPSTAEMFRTIALNVKMALLPVLQAQVFID